MESCQQLDAFGCPAVQHTLALFISCALLLSANPISVLAQTKTSETQIEQLFKQEHWQKIVDLQPTLGISSEVDLDYGIALARLGRWNEAEAAFKSGLRLNPNDPRFMVELAGVAFQNHNYGVAQSWLRRALRYSPRDAYNLDFLATVFYLEANLEAALKYWNRIGKPRIQSVISEPEPRVNPVLLDRAFAFSPATTLNLRALRTTEARLSQLDLFSRFRSDLQARSDGTFDFVFHNSQRNGCGANKWECLLTIVGQSPAQTLNFNYFNIRYEAINFRSGLRWDGEKRRIIAELESPILGTPKWHFRVGTDLRNENWGIRSSFSGSAPLLAALNLKREAIKAQFTDVLSGQLQWSTETEVSHRAYHNVLPGNVLTNRLLTHGVQLKQSFAINSSALRWPEHRFTTDVGASLSVARLWSNSGRDFAALQASARLHWFPQHSGDKYEIQHLFRVGRTFGDPPFDELFMLGVLGDTELRMKAHIATRDGKKGSAPLGRNYLLSNWEATRELSPFSLLHLKVGPFVDTGKISDPDPALGSPKWLWDVGIEAKAEILGFGVIFSYGRDLRSGRNAFVASTP